MLERRLRIVQIIVRVARLAYSSGDFNLTFFGFKNDGNTAGRCKYF
jgi:hypothetical protein